MTEFIPYILLGIGYFIFSSLFERYMIAHKEIDLITGQILMAILLFSAIEFAEQQEITSFLTVFIILFFIEKFRKLVKE
ncbi:hypothetical protein BU107_13735 [Staphylococcus xylosus]|uniref:hypothetical protein n=1 Tax=Staphylococcus xylosus TaxID=1288 RepID=UPI000E67778E|nr:hypothetical protein [Staphylococcus xylosus]RIM84250.1 hypothetical protein BU107_13735 [Staphylococcus xylosus]